MPALVFTGEKIRLTDLVTDHDPELVDVTFERCRISGPVLLQPLGSALVNNDYGIAAHDLDAALWTINPWTELAHGSIVARRCIFRDCVFSGVAFVGAEELITQLRSAVLRGLVLAS